MGDGASLRKGARCVALFFVSRVTVPDFVDNHELGANSKKYRGLRVSLVANFISLGPFSGQVQKCRPVA